MSVNNKETLLQAITEAATIHLVTKKELLTAYEKGLGDHKGRNILRSITLTELFSSIGCGIIFLGISLLVSQHWHSLSSANKIMLTLGSGVAAYLMGVLFGRDNRVKIISPSFFFLSALLIPFGLAVAFNPSGLNDYSFKFYVLISGISFFIYFLSYLIFEKDFFLFYSILFATWFFYSAVNYLYHGADTDFNIYCTVIVGLSYILLGTYFDSRAKNTLTGFLYGFGSLAFLGGLFTLDVLFKDPILEWAFPLIIFVMIYLSVRLKANSFLTFGIIFLVFWIFEMTDRYFSQSLGWPIALVLVGFLLILIAYSYFQIKKKYFK